MTFDAKPHQTGQTVILIPATQLSQIQSGSVPNYLIRLWQLVEDENHPDIYWSEVFFHQLHDKLNVLCVV